jgi:hypothetical protein
MLLLLQVVFIGDTWFEWHVKNEVMHARDANEYTAAGLEAGLYGIL